MLTARPLTATAWPFPARVWAPGAAEPTRRDLSGGDPPTWAMARIHAQTATRLRVIAMVDGNPTVVATIEVTEHEPPGRRTAAMPKLWHVVDTDGQTWVVARGHGCGCGHPLKRLNPSSL